MTLPKGTLKRLIITYGAVEIKIICLKLLKIFTDGIKDRTEHGGSKCL